MNGAEKENKLGHLYVRTDLFKLDAGEIYIPWFTAMMVEVRSFAVLSDRSFNDNRTNLPSTANVVPASGPERRIRSTCPMYSIAWAEDKRHLLQRYLSCGKIARSNIASG